VVLTLPQFAIILPTTYPYIPRLIETRSAINLSSSRLHRPQNSRPFIMITRQHSLSVRHCTGLRLPPSLLTPSVTPSIVFFFLHTIVLVFIAYNFYLCIYFVLILWFYFLSFTFSFFFPFPYSPYFLLLFTSSFSIQTRLSVNVRHMSMLVFCVMPCELLRGYQRFGRTYCLHLQVIIIWLYSPLRALASPFGVS
jgi:ABC-type multidrug transport system permease subunit